MRCPWAATERVQLAIRPEPPKERPDRKKLTRTALQGDNKALSLTIRLESTETPTQTERKPSGRVVRTSLYSEKHSSTK